MQNDLEEFYAMVDFCNPGILGDTENFRKRFLNPILRGREPDATPRQKERMMECQQELSEMVNPFILRRINTLNAEHLPPKLVQVRTEKQKSLCLYSLPLMYCKIQPFLFHYPLL
jgi:DNA repair and recombination RAD54-like protein